MISFRKQIMSSWKRGDSWGIKVETSLVCRRLRKVDIDQFFGRFRKGRHRSVFRGIFRSVDTGLFFAADSEGYTQIWFAAESEKKENPYFVGI